MNGTAGAEPRTATGLPADVALVPLRGRGDAGGWTIDLFSADWPLSVRPVQWNLVRSCPNSLRGIHVHVGHWDYLCVINGSMLLGLRDVRPHAETHGMSAQIRLQADEPRGVAIPPGVAHGFYFSEPTTYCYSVSRYWTPADEFGCRWDDPDLGFSWPTTDPVLSERDATASSYWQMVSALAAALARGAGSE